MLAVRTDYRPTRIHQACYRPRHRRDGAAGTAIPHNITPQLPLDHTNQRGTTGRMELLEHGHRTATAGAVGKKERKDLASFQIANGGERRHVMCVWLNPGPLGSEPSALTNCASSSCRSRRTFWGLRAGWSSWLHPAT